MAFPPLFDTPGITVTSLTSSYVRDYAITWDDPISDTNSLRAWYRVANFADSSAFHVLQDGQAHSVNLSLPTPWAQNRPAPHPTHGRVSFHRVIDFS